MTYPAYRRMLSNPRYLGVCAFGRKRSRWSPRKDHDSQVLITDMEVSIVRSQELRMVLDELFNQVQAAFAGNGDATRALAVTTKSRTVGSRYGLSHVHFRAAMAARSHVDRQTAGTESGRRGQSAQDGERGKKLQRLRGEKTERNFAHVCEMGGARRTWLTGIDKLRKRYLISAAAHNLGVLMHMLFNMGTSRGLQQFANGLSGVVSSLNFACLITVALETVLRRTTAEYRTRFQKLPTPAAPAAEPAEVLEFA